MVEVAVAAAMAAAAATAPPPIARASEMHAVAETTTTRPRPWFSIQWHITSRCDQRCKHCYDANREGYPEELSSELSLGQCRQVLDSLVEFCAIARARSIACFTGGDPLLREDIFAVFEYAREKNTPFNILGNPYHLSDENIERMKALGLRSYQVSIDGMQEKHDWLRKPGSFDATCKAIRMLNGNGVQTIVMFTLSQENADDLFPVMTLCAELDVDIFAFARYCAPPNALLRCRSFSPKEYREFLIAVDDHVKTLQRQGCKTRFNRKDHLWKLLLHERGELSLGNLADQIVAGCHLGQHINILSNGTVYACRRFNSPIGKVPEQSLLDIFVSDEMDCYRQVEMLDKCSSCPLLKHCRGCPAVAYSATGNWRSPDPQCWRNAEAK